MSNLAQTGRWSKHEPKLGTASGFRWPAGSGRWRGWAEEVSLPSFSCRLRCHFKTLVRSPYRFDSATRHPDSTPDRSPRCARPCSLSNGLAIGRPSVPVPPFAASNLLPTQPRLAPQPLPSLQTSMSAAYTVPSAEVSRTFIDKHSRWKNGRGRAGLKFGRSRTGLS